MKVLKLNDKSYFATIESQVMREMCALTLLRGHPNVVELKEVLDSDNGKTVFIFEFMESDLLKLLRGVTGTSFGLAPKFAKSLAFQILQGISHCHRNQIMHRDLKPSNILINSNGHIKISDFGMCRSFSLNEEQCYTNYGACTLWYRPPELLLGAS